MPALASRHTRAPLYPTHSIARILMQSAALGRLRAAFSLHGRGSRKLLKTLIDQDVAARARVTTAAAAAAQKRAIVGMAFSSEEDNASPDVALTFQRSVPRRARGSRCLADASPEGVWVLV